MANRRAKKADMLLERGNLSAGWLAGRWASGQPNQPHLARRPHPRVEEPPLDLPLLNELEQKMIRISQAEMPNEAVGALIKDDEASQVRLMVFRNIATGISQFRIPDADVIRLHKMNKERPGSVWGLWHSHPGGMMVPSQRDCSSHPSFIRHLIIVCPREGDVLYYRRAEEAQGAA